MLLQVYRELGGGAAGLAILLAMIALVGALAGVATSYVVAGRSVYINSITAERSKWIDKLRTNLAAYSAILAELSFTMLETNSLPKVGIADVSRIAEIVKRQNAIVSVIQLQLNPWGVFDKNLLLLLEGILVRSSTDHMLVDEADRLLVKHSQWLLKAEWEKVKYEARGPVHRFLNGGRAKRRIAQYEEWVVGEGNLSPLLARFREEKAKH